MRGRDAGAPAVTAAGARPDVVAAEVDWVHVCRAEGVVARAADLVADVRIDRTPRRSLTLYAPTRVSWVTVLPASATLRTAIAAEGVRGSVALPVLARVRVEVDDMDPIEREVRVRPGEPWSELTIDLTPFANRAARVTFASVSAPPDEDAGNHHSDSLAGFRDGAARSDVRVAFADPRVLARTQPTTALPPVRHVLFIIVRGLRSDRIFPTVSERLSHGGFSRMVREGLSARAIVPSSREVVGLSTMMTGLSPEGHRIEEWTDTLDERAPTVGSILREGGLSTALFTDDKWIEGSGLDRGYGEVRSCPGDAVRCRAEIPLGLAAEWLVGQRDRRAFAMVVTRAGIPPFDPPRDLLTALDPNPPENALQPESTAQYALNPRANEHATFDRLQILYDAAIANVDRSLGQTLDRLREANLLDQTAIVLVGSRGTALGEARWIGEGPSHLTVMNETALLLRAPGVRPRALTEAVDALDANATVLERLSVQGPWRGAFAPVSLATVGALGVHPRGFVTALGPRYEPALRFGDLLALTTRGGTNVVLVSPSRDPLAMEDLRSSRPIALAFAEQTLSAHRESGGIDAERYAPSTRLLPELVAAALRQGTQRR